MAEIAHVSSVAAPVAATRNAPNIKADLRTLAYWVSLGAAAGGLGGFLVGGIGGRLAMLLLRFTSPDFIRGLESDDGFTMGRFDLTSTLSLLGVTTLMGTVVGLVIVFGRPFFPHRWMPLAWGFAGGAVGGALFIHTDGVDFNLLEPTWLAIALFVVVPASGGLLIAGLVEIYHRWVWWKRWWWTALAAIPAVPALIFFPVALTAITVALVWLAVMRRERTREIHRWLPSRIVGWAVFAVVVAISLAQLTNDTRELL